MIVILGDTHDDILYFDSVLANKKEEVLLNRYTIALGTIFSQEVLVVHEMFSSILTSAVLSHILERYYVDLVIVVGKCVAVSDNLKNGDIALANKVIDVNADLSLVNNVGIAQIPGFDREFPVQDDIKNYLAANLEKREKIDFHRVTFLSSDNLSADTHKYLKENKTIFSQNDELLVIDHNSSGVAISSTLKNTPFVVVKVIENQLEKVNNLDTYSKVLSRYIDLGKSVVSTINDIGRSDILEGDE